MSTWSAGRLLHLVGEGADVLGVELAVDVGRRHVPFRLGLRRPPRASEGERGQQLERSRGHRSSPVGSAASVAKFPRRHNARRRQAAGASAVDHRVADRQRAGQPGRFDAEEVDETRDAMVARPRHDEVRRLVLGPHDLRSDPGIARREPPVREPRPVLADRGVEAVGAARVDVVADRVDPLDVGSEARLAAEVDGDVHPEAGLVRHRVDEPRERRLPDERVVVALRVVGRRHVRGREAGERGGDPLRVKPARVHHRPGADAERLVAAGRDLDAVVAHRAAGDRALEGDHRAVRLRVALQREHEGVAVDHPGRGREVGRHATQLRLERARLGGGERPQVGHPVRLGLPTDRVQLRELVLGGGHEQLAAAPVGDAALVAVAVERVLARDAEARLERAGRVVDAGVDDLGVARAGLGADRVGGLQDHYLPAGEREGARHGQADDTGADYDGVQAIHPCLAHRIGHGSAMVCAEEALPGMSPIVLTPL